jgi:3-oxoacyl-[acyl-carrier protein] reductase
MIQKTIVVSGTSRGLGLEIARDLATDHRVIGFARSAVETGRGNNFEHISGLDAEDPQTLERLATYLAEAEGLVNNIGVGIDGLFVSQPWKAVQQLMAVNSAFPMQLTQVYLRERLARHQAGVVVTVGSIAGQNGYSGLAVYGAAKAALEGWTRGLAREMGRKGFRFNMVIPGFLETDMTAGLGEAELQRIARRSALGRLGKPEDVVPAVRFLLSDGAHFITGTSLVVDGGATA